MDPRVSSLLHRLGGLYRDPSRVDRDASSLLKSSVGAHLKPNIGPLVENNGQESSCLVLKGTIAMHFKGKTYQVLIDLYLPPGYPLRAPVAYVRLGAPNMYLKERHPHVGDDGCVYLPYLHEWRPHSHNLVELVVAMSSVFGNDPPVFTRAAAAPPPPPPAAAKTYPAAASLSSPGYNSVSKMDRDLQKQLEKVVAKEAEEANQVVAAARAAEVEEQRALAAHEAWEAQKFAEVKEKVATKLKRQLQELESQTKQQMIVHRHDQTKLEQKQLQKQLDFLERTKSELHRHHDTIDKATGQVQEWLDQYSSQNTSTKTVEVDDMCVPASPLHQQMLDLSAENASLTDALYFLDRSLNQGNLELGVHLKHVRQLAKRQFMVRAHLMKIGQVVAVNSNGR